MKYIVDIKGELEGDYEIIGKYEEKPQVVIFSENMTEEEKQKLIAEFKSVMDNAKFTVEPERQKDEYIEEDIMQIIKENFDIGYEMAKNKYERQKGDKDEYNCFHCKYASKPAYEEPCNKCKHSYDNKFEWNMRGGGDK